MLNHIMIKIKLEKFFSPPPPPFNSNLVMFNHTQDLLKQLLNHQSTVMFNHTELWFYLSYRCAL